MLSVKFYLLPPFIIESYNVNIGMDPLSLSLSTDLTHTHTHTHTLATSLIGPLTATEQIQ